jgi:hypothetical protein
MDMVRILVDHSLAIKLCFCPSLFLFMIMNFVDFIMPQFCAGYETGILDNVFHRLIMGIMDHYGL